MSTTLSFLSGRQITNSNGVPQNGAKLFHYRAGTTTDLTVWTNQGASVAHAQPVVCDSGGIVPLIYIDDTFDWKVLITTSGGATLYTYDNLPKAVTATSAATFASPQFQWSTKTSANSPVTLTSSDAGNAYIANTTSGNITFNLPSAATVGNGKGFVFKKGAAANTLTLTPSGSETINGSSSATRSLNNVVFSIYSDGANWHQTFELSIAGTNPTIQRFTSGSGTYTPATGVQWIRVRMVGGGGGGGARTTNNGGNGGTSTFGGWTAVGGTGGTAGGATGAAGGTGGTTGTGTLLARYDGGRGHDSLNLTPQSGGGGGNSAFFGGGGAWGTGSAADGLPAVANSGGGGGSPHSSGVGVGAAGGGGESVEFMVTSPAAVSYAVGAAGAGGAAGGNAGGNGAAGIIIVEEYYPFRTGGGSLA